MKNMKLLSRLLCAVVAVALSITAHAYQGMPIPKLHVSGRFLQDPGGNNVLLHGYMQPAASWFNGEGNNFSNPTDFTSPANVSGALNFYQDVATILATTNAQYGQSHGWTASYVRFIGDHTSVQNFAPGWDVNGNLANAAQFNGWIQNVLVPYVTHCKSVGLYVVICGNPSVAYPGGDTSKNMTQQYQQNLITFWQTVANTAGIKSADNVMFEICNEPIAIETSFGANNWGSGSAAYWSALKNFMQPIVDAIRNTGADNITWIPALGWQGECQDFANYPVNGSNLGYAGHLYPAYGGVFDNATAVQNLWNSNYKPTADNAPLIITELWWNPNDGSGYQNLWNAHTSGFGNAVKTAMDNQGNVSYLIGMVHDLLANLNSGLSATTLSSGEGAQAAFAWWPTYIWAAPSGGGGGPIANGTYRIIARHSGKAMSVQKASTANGAQIIQNSYSSGSNQKWTLTDTGNGEYTIVGVQSGKPLEVYGGSTANGAKVNIWGGSPQKFTLTATGGGYYRITPTYVTGSCLEVANGSVANNAKVQLWNWSGGTAQQWALLAP